MMAKTFRKWCPACRKLVGVSSAEEKCPNCGTIIPIPPHEKFGYAPPGPGPVPPPGPGPGPGPVPPPGPLGPPSPEGPTHEDIVAILDRIERTIAELAKKIK